MKRISAGLSLFFAKRLFPILWFGFLGFFVLQALRTGALEQDWVFGIGPVVMAVFGYYLMKKLVWDLADEVYDGGDFLLVRNRGEEERVALCDIINVSSSTNMSPPRVTLRLAHPGKFGSEIAFSPLRHFTLDPFAKNQVVEDLIVRVDAARRR